MGSEMCIRDRHNAFAAQNGGSCDKSEKAGATQMVNQIGKDQPGDCLLYTSDAADERSRGDLGGRRIIKKKKTETSIEGWLST